MEGAAGFSHFPGNLDPRAQEFIPRNLLSSLPLLSPPLYYPPPPPPLPLPFPLPAFHSQPPVYVNTNHHHHHPPSMTLPSRSLIISMVPADISESILRRDLEVFGDVRAVQMGRLRDGIVTVNFYDIRQARRALVVIQEQNMQQQYRLRKYYDEINAAAVSASRNSVPFSGMNLVSFIPPPPVPPPAPGLIAGRPVWAHFTVPVSSTMPNGINQGTLVIFNLDPGFPSFQLKRIFEPYGHVKELRETPMKKGHRFVEFYDVRDAAVALSEMNGKEIYGNKILIEYSRPGGHCKKLSKLFRNVSKNNRWYSDNHPVATAAWRPLRITPCSPPTPPLPTPRITARLPDKGIRGPSSSSSSGNGIEELGFSSSSIQLKSKSVRSSNPSCSKYRLQRPRSFIATGNSRKFKELDSNFLINEEAIMESNCSDSRTTVMIKNIPNKYSLKIFLNLLDDHCIRSNGDGNAQPPLSSYDFVYLPIDFINKCNVGYGFVNMTSPEATWRLYKAFHHQNWEIFNSRKICQVTYARLQGLEALKEHFKNSKFSCDVDEYMPMTFSPPRDGRIQTEPVPIVGRYTTSSSSPGASSSKDKSDDGDFHEHEEFNGKINGSDKAGGYEADGYDEELNGGGSSSSSGGQSGGEYFYEGGDDVVVL